MYSWYNPLFPIFLDPPLLLAVRRKVEIDSISKIFFSCSAKVYPGTDKENSGDKNSDWGKIQEEL